MTQSCQTYDLREHQRLQIALISDTHGLLMPEVLQVANQCDVVLHAGDIMGQSALAPLRPKLGLVVAVLGNNDFSATWDASDRGILDNLTESVIVQCAGGDIAMEHGHRVPRIEIDHSALGYKYADARLVVYGHTHVQWADTESLPWLVNPGAAGQTRNHGGASCTVVSIDDSDWKLQEYKFPAIMKAG